MMKLTFVGSGVSCAIPCIGHFSDTCACYDAVIHPDGPNRRNNVSMMITVPKAGAQVEEDAKSDAGTHTFDTANARILIDCGKTFRDAYFRVLAPRSVRYVDALFITHGHADAMQCVEELCNLHTETRRAITGGAEAGEAVHSKLSTSAAEALAASCLSYIPTYLIRPALKEIADVSPQLTSASHYYETTPGNASEYVEQRRTAASTCAESPGAVLSRDTALDVYYLPEDRVVPCYVAAIGDDIPMYSLPVEHGKNYMCLAYVFGKGTAFKSQGATAEQMGGKSCVVYMSDVSTIPDFALRFLQDLVKIDVFVFDVLAEKNHTSPPHTCWDDAMPIFRQLVPRKVYCVGMFCSIIHDVHNAEWVKDLAAEREKITGELSDPDRTMSAEERERLQRFLREVESIELAYDGLEIDVPL